MQLRGRRVARKVSLVSLVAVAALAMASTPNASAQETLAASCEPPREDSSLGWTYVAQVFTPQFTGPLTRAEIDITKSSGTADYVIEIRTVDGSGRPTTSILATTTVSNASVPMGDSFISASFRPTNVVAGQVYALVVHRTADLSVGFRVGDDCPNGAAWFGPSNDPAGWGSDGFQDMVFRVFVTLPPPPAPAPTSPPKIPTCKGKPATITGTEGNNRLSGTPAADVIGALGGNDNVSGLAGNDTICGGAGKDNLKGGGGKDTLLGQKGKDTLKGAGGKDLCKGGKGEDSAFACEVEKSI